MVSGHTLQVVYGVKHLKIGPNKILWQPTPQPRKFMVFHVCTVLNIDELVPVQPKTTQMNECLNFDLIGFRCFLLHPHWLGHQWRLCLCGGPWASTCAKQRGSLLEFGAILKCLTIINHLKSWVTLGIGLFEILNPIKT